MEEDEAKPNTHTDPDHPYLHGVRPSHKAPPPKNPDDAWADAVTDDENLADPNNFFTKLSSRPDVKTQSGPRFQIEVELGRELNKIVHSDEWPEYTTPQEAMHDWFVKGLIACHMSPRPTSSVLNRLLSVHRMNEELEQALVLLDNSLTVAEKFQAVVTRFRELGNESIPRSICRKMAMAMIDFDPTTQPAIQAALEEFGFELAPEDMPGYERVWEDERDLPPNGYQT